MASTVAVLAVPHDEYALVTFIEAKRREGWSPCCAISDGRMVFLLSDSHYQRALLARVADLEAQVAAAADACKKWDVAHFGVDARLFERARGVARRALRILRGEP